MPRAKNPKAQPIDSFVVQVNGEDITVGNVIYNVFGNLANKSFTDKDWGNTAKQFNNEITVAKYYTEVLNQSTTDLETLRDVIQPVTQLTDVSSDTLVAQLIGVALMTGGTGY